MRLNTEPGHFKSYCDIALLFCTFDPAAWLGVKRSQVQVLSPRLLNDRTFCRSQDYIG
jgi:hypothetical protein